MILHVDTYDPQSPEDGPSRGSAYFSKKDAKWIFLILIVLGIMMTPVYAAMLGERNKHVCQANMSQIFKAVALYAESHDGRFPPAFETTSDGSPRLDDKGRSFTWISLVQDGMNARQSFKCPEAKDPEATRSLHPEKSDLTIEATYGIYFPYAGYSIANVPNPDQVVIFGETSNLGSEGSADPQPYKGQDGFVIGFDDSNRDVSGKAKYVTRLAFPKSSEGFKEEGPTRHKKGIYLMNASGATVQYTPEISKLELNAQGKPTGKWAIPAGWGPN